MLIQLRYLVKQYPTTSSWGGETWDSSYDTKPVLQFWDGENWVDVPTVIEVQDAHATSN